MTVLILGAGMVTGPLFEYLHTHKISFSVVSCLEKELQSVKGSYPDAACHCMDVSDPKLPSLISQHELIINSLPQYLMLQVTKMCISQGRNMLSAGDVTPELMQLNQKAIDAGLLLLCECGVDPGVDHMLAMEVIDRVTAEGGKITSFASWCGGIPAPECRNNPLQYKFSWNPKGALMVSHSDGGYIKNGQTVMVSASQLLDEVYSVDTSSLNLPGVLLEGHTSEFYGHHLKAYGLENIQYFFRGTLRYQGFCDAVKGLIQAGLFRQDYLPLLQPSSTQVSWRNLVNFLVLGTVDDENFMDNLLVKLNNSTNRIEALRELGLLSDRAVDKQGTPFDTLAAHLMHTLAYGPEERDMVVLLHEIQSKRPGQDEEMTRIGLVVYGDVAGHSAMAKTVGYPLGIAAQLILRGEIKIRGVVLPTTPDIYQPVLTALAGMGISAQVTTQTC